MFKTIVWATDGSENADSALPIAKELAKITSGSVVVVHADEHFAGGRSTGEPVLADEPELVTKIRSQVKQLEEEGLTADLKVVHGTDSPAELIAQAAQEAAADVIVVGTRGLGPVVGAVVGSVTQHLLHEATCPVLAVPARGR
jgi:nucleotide-binding universal stress UspA family protein